MFWYAGFWQRITWLGDSILLLPIAVLIALWLALRPGTRPLSWRWLLLFGTGAAMVAASKIAFMGWGIGSVTLNFTGFSGHTMLSASVYPVALWLIGSTWSHRTRVVLAVLGWGFAAAIGWSRLAIYAHSKSEVASAYLLGLAVSACFLWWQQHRPHPRVNWTLVVVSLATPFFFIEPGTTQAPTHDLLERLSMQLAGVERPFNRGDLLARRAAQSTD